MVPATELLLWLGSVTGWMGAQMNELSSLFLGLSEASVSHAHTAVLDAKAMLVPSGHSAIDLSAAAEPL